MRAPCVIVIDPDGHKFLGKEEINVETGGVSYFEIVNFLKLLQGHFSAEIVKEAKKHVGNDDKLIEDWIQKHLDDYLNK